jgi:hypothetical protein
MSGEASIDIRRATAAFGEIVLEPGRFGKSAAARGLDARFGCAATVD